MEIWILLKQKLKKRHYRLTEFAKLLVPILKPLTSNEFTVRDSFHFAEEIIDQETDIFVCSLDIDSLFTDIRLEKIIEICTNELFKESETVERLLNLSLRSFYLWLLKICALFLMEYFINKLMVLAMGSPLGPKLAM